MLIQVRDDVGQSQVGAVGNGPSLDTAVGRANRAPRWMGEW